MDIIGKWVKFDLNPVSSTICYNCHRAISKRGYPKNYFYTASSEEEGIVMDFHIQFESMISEVKDILTTMRRILKGIF